MGLYVQASIGVLNIHSTWVSIYSTHRIPALSQLLVLLILPPKVLTSLSPMMRPPFSVLELATVSPYLQCFVSPAPEVSGLFGCL